MEAESAPQVDAAAQQQALLQQLQQEHQAQQEQQLAQLQALQQQLAAQAAAAPAVQPAQFPAQLTLQQLQQLQGLVSAVNLQPAQAQQLQQLQAAAHVASLPQEQQAMLAALVAQMGAQQAKANSEGRGGAGGQWVNYAGGGGENGEGGEGGEEVVVVPEGRMRFNSAWLLQHDMLLLHAMQQARDAGARLGDKFWPTVTELMNSADPVHWYTHKQVRERWGNRYENALNKRGGWTPKEEYVFALSHSKVGNKWVRIKADLPHRTENTIKNHFNSTGRSHGSVDKARGGTLFARYCRAVYEKQQQAKAAANAAMEAATLGLPPPPPGPDASVATYPLIFAEAVAACIARDGAEAVAAYSVEQNYFVKHPLRPDGEGEAESQEDDAQVMVLASKLRDDIEADRNAIRERSFTVNWLAAGGQPVSVPLRPPSGVTRPLPQMLPPMPMVAQTKVRGQKQAMQAAASAAAASAAAAAALGGASALQAAGAAAGGQQFIMHNGQLLLGPDGMPLMQALLPPTPPAPPPAPSGGGGGGGRGRGASSGRGRKKRKNGWDDDDTDDSDDDDDDGGRRKSGGRGGARRGRGRGRGIGGGNSHVAHSAASSVYANSTVNGMPFVANGGGGALHGESQAERERREQNEAAVALIQQHRANGGVVDPALAAAAAAVAAGQYAVPVAPPTPPVNSGADQIAQLVVLGLLSQLTQAAAAGGPVAVQAAAAAASNDPAAIAVANTAVAEAQKVMSGGLSLVESAVSVMSPEALSMLLHQPVVAGLLDATIPEPTADVPALQAAGVAGLRQLRRQLLVASRRWLDAASAGAQSAIDEAIASCS